MNTEQERAAFEAWKTKNGNWVYVEIDSDALEIFKAGYRAALQSQGREDVKRPVLDSIVDEIHRRADKEWADDGYDFEVTITADEYKALCEEEKAIDHARRIEGGSNADS